MLQAGEIWNMVQGNIPPTDFGLVLQAGEILSMALGNTPSTDVELVLQAGEILSMLLCNIPPTVLGNTVVIYDVIKNRNTQK